MTEAESLHELARHYGLPPGYSLEVDTTPLVPRPGQRNELEATMAGTAPKYRLGQLAECVEERNKLREDVMALQDACDRAMRSSESWETWGMGWKARAEEARAELARTWARLDAAMAMLRAAGVQDELLTAALDGAARKVDGDGAAA